MQRSLPTGRQGCRAGPPWLAEVALLCGLLLSPGPALSQSLSDLVASNPEGETLSLAAGQTTGRADLTGALVIQGSGDSQLVAPADDAILVLLPGADLALSGVTLSQAGRSTIAIHVEGGRLSLSDCRIEGDFGAAIQVLSGQVTIRDCHFEGGQVGVQAGPGSTVTLERVTMTGQGDTAIFAEGAELGLSAVTLTGDGQNGLVVTGTSTVTADGLTVSDAASVGVWIEGATTASLHRLVVQGPGQALALTGIQDATLDGFLLHGEQGALQAQGITSRLALSRGLLRAGPGVTAVSLHEIAGLALSDVTISGGETGLYATGPISGAVLDRVILHSQTGTGLFLDGTESDVPPVLTNLRAIAAGSTYAAYFRDSGPVLLDTAALIGAGDILFGSEGRSAPSFRDSVLIGPPDLAQRHLAFVSDAEARPQFLPDGPIWWASDPAIRPGSRAITVAALGSTLDPAMGLQGAVLDFGLGRTFDPGTLALALDYALPAAPEAATDKVDVTLASPEPGWLWDGKAIRITLTGPDGNTVEVWPADFPLNLTPGDYALALDGRPMGRVAIAADTVLTLPLPDAPFYAWRDDTGQKWRGRALYLRPKAELAALLAGFRPLRPGEFWGYTPLFAPRAGADRALAAETIARARDRLPAILSELAMLRDAEDWPAFNLRWMEADILLDVLAAFGSAEDAAWLLTLPLAEQVGQLETAVLIEMRLGILKDGASLPLARDWLAAGLPTDDTARRNLIRLVQSLARTGLPEGCALLADLIRNLQASTDQPDPTGIIELARLDPDLAADLPSRFLDRVDARLQSWLDGNLPQGDPDPVFLDLWNAAIASLAHEVVYAPAGTPTRRLPVPPGAGIGASAWAFADPVTALSGPLGLVGPTDPNRLSGWTYRFPDYICAALAYRTPADRALQLADLRNTVIATIGQAFLDADPTASADIFTQVEFALDLVLGECVLSDPVLQSFGRDAAGEEAALFDNLEYEPFWWLRRPRTEAQLAAFARGEDYPVLSGHSPVPLDTAEAALATGTGADPDLKAAFLARHRLLSDAFQGNQDQLTFGSEHRKFRLRSENGNGSITLAGYLDIRPILTDGQLILAIRHRIESPDFGGLAAMITEPDRAPYEADNRLLMFEAVSLDRGGTVTTMTHQGTSAGGVHFFATPWTGDLSDLTLHLGMRFVDTTWDIDLPLWASTLAHELRAKGGTP